MTRRLTADQVSEFRAALCEQRQFRLEQLAQLADEQTVGADRSGALEVTAALKRAAAHALSEVARALSRLEDGSFGRCLGCGQFINPERLEILPAAALCMACQRGVDQGYSTVPVVAATGARQP